MFNLKKLLNSKIIALTAAAGLAPLIGQSVLAQSTNTGANSELFNNQILLSQAINNPGNVPTTNPGNIPTTNPGNVPTTNPTSPNGVQRNIPGSTPINPNPTNGIDTRDYNSPGDQLESNPTINSPGDQLDNDATINSPGDQLNSDDGYTNSPGDQIDSNGGFNSPGNQMNSDPGYIGVPAR